MSQYPQKQSKLVKLARLFDDQPAARQRTLGMAGIAYGALVCILLVTGIVGDFLALLLFLSLPGAALLSWAAFKSDSVEPGVARFVGTQSSRYRMESHRDIEHDTALRQLSTEDLRREPLAEREKHLATLPVQIQDRRANEIREQLETLGRPATVAELARQTKWTEEAVVSGLARLHELGVIQEDFPDTHAMQWRYLLASSPMDDEFDRLVRNDALAATQDDVFAASRHHQHHRPTLKDDVSVESEYAIDASVDTTSRKS